MSISFKHAVRSRADGSVSLSVTYSGHQKCEASHRWGKGVRQQYILHMIVSGRGTYTTPEGSFSPGPGDIFLIRPFTEIEYAADSDDPWEYYWVNFTGTDAEVILNRTDFTPRSPVMHCQGSEIADAMEDIFKCGSGSNEDLELTGRLYILLSLLVKASVGRNQSDSAGKSCVKAAMDYISINYPLPLSVEDIAEAAGVSRTTLFRTFKAELGIPPADYLIEYRIGQAKKLLSATDISINAAARSAGYEDSLYFSRAFRKITGMSPTEYRRRVADANSLVPKQK